MKTITINVSEPVYRTYKQYAKKADRTTSELIREAMESYRDKTMRPQPSIRELTPLALGKMLRPFAADDDILEEMHHD